MFVISYIYYCILNIVGGFSLSKLYIETTWLLTSSTGLSVIIPSFLNSITGVGWFMVDLLICKCICLEDKKLKGIGSLLGTIGLYSVFIIFVVNSNNLSNHYYLYYFPLVRIIEYKAGQILYDIYQSHNDSLKTHSLSLCISSIITAVIVHIYIALYRQFADVSGIVLLLSSCFLIFGLSLRDYTNPIMYPNIIKWICRHLYEFYLFHFIFAKYLVALPIRYPSFWIVILLDVFVLIIFAYIVNLLYVKVKPRMKKLDDS